jgi:hypothetical protein
LKASGVPACVPGTALAESLRQVRGWQEDVVKQKEIRGLVADEAIARVLRRGDAGGSPLEPVGPQVAAVVTHEVDKDLIHLDNRAIGDRIFAGATKE